MREDLIELPAVNDIKDLLESAKNDINEELQEDPETAAQSKLLLAVINIIQGKIGNTQNLNSLELTEKINIAAHLNFLQDLLEDFFFTDDFDEEDGEEFDLNGYDESVDEDETK